MRRRPRKTCSIRRAAREPNPWFRLLCNGRADHAESGQSGREQIALNHRYNVSPMPEDFQASCLLEPLPVAAYLWDIETQKFFAANDALLQLVGYTEEELRSMDWRTLVVADELATAHRAIEVGAVMKAVRWHWRRKDGTVIAVTLASRQTTLIDDNGRVREVYVALVLNVGEDGSVPARAAFP
jgi:PAS domain S-box-containing protein